MQQRPVKQIELKCKHFNSAMQDDFLFIVVQNPSKEDRPYKDDYVSLTLIDENGTRFESKTEGVVTKANYDHATESLTIVQRVVRRYEDLNQVDTQYFDALRDIITNGIMDENRTNKRAQHLFGHQMKFDLRDGFPLITTKYCNTNAIERELLWFLRGETNISTLGSKIWDEWATEDGELGPVYGAQWRHWQAFNLVDIGEQEKLDFLLEQGYVRAGETVDNQLVMFKKVDQLQELVDSLRKDPNNRRNLVTAWNPANNPDTKYTPNQNAKFGMQALPPCHTMWQVCGARMSTKDRLVEYVSLQSRRHLNDPQWMTDKDIERQASAVGKTPIELLEDRVLDHLNSTADNFEEKDRQVDSEHLRTRGEYIAMALDELGAPKFYLDLQLYQRSADMYLGVPFNIASYALLLMLLAESTNMVARRFIHTLGNYHIYENQFPMIEEQLKEKPRPLPRLFVKRAHEQIADYTQDDFELQGYQHGPKLERGEVAV